MQCLTNSHILTANSGFRIYSATLVYKPLGFLIWQGFKFGQNTFQIFLAKLFSLMLSYHRCHFRHCGRFKHISEWNLQLEVFDDLRNCLCCCQRVSSEIEKVIVDADSIQR